MPSIEEVIPIVDVGDVDIVSVVPIVRPIFRPRINGTEPIPAVLKAWISSNDQKGESVDAEPMFWPKVSPKAIVGNTVAVVAAALLPVAVVGIPVSGAMFLPSGVLDTLLFLSPARLLALLRALLLFIVALRLLPSMLLRSMPLLSMLGLLVLVLPLLLSMLLLSMLGRLVLAGPLLLLSMLRVPVLAGPLLLSMLRIGLGVFVPALLLIRTHLPLLLSLPRLLLLVAGLLLLSMLLFGLGLLVFGLVLWGMVLLFPVLLLP